MRDQLFFQLMTIALPELFEYFGAIHIDFQKIKKHIRQSLAQEADLRIAFPWITWKFMREDKQLALTR